MSAEQVSKIPSLMGTEMLGGTFPSPTSPRTAQRPHCKKNSAKNENHGTIVPTKSGVSNIKFCSNGCDSHTACTRFFLTNWHFIDHATSHGCGVGYASDIWDLNL
jgi:hypothetical protein